MKADLNELAELQKQPEEASNVVQGQKRSEQTFDQFALRLRALQASTTGLGARWGLQSEATFHDEVTEILADLGFHVDRYIAQDTECEVFPDPTQIELDIVVQDGKLILIEIKSSMSKADIYAFDDKVKFYEKREGKLADRRIIITSYIEPNGVKAIEWLGIEVFTQFDEVA